METISIVLPCYNEEANIEQLYEQINNAIALTPEYTFELLFIDNASTDKTVEKIKELIAHDNRVRLIVNARNFGHIRSPYYGMLQANGDAVILMASDLQDPPELISEFIKQWKLGYKIVAGVKTTSDESKLFYAIRKAYYAFVYRIANVRLVNNFTGFGLYDKSVIVILRTLNDPYPYLRGLVCEIGFDIATVPFNQPRRKRGITKNNFYTLYDMAILGITSHSKVPLRIAVFAGFCMGLVSLGLAFLYLILKLIAWHSFQLGSAPLLIGLFFFSSIQLFFLGVLGEYIGNLYTQVVNRPLVIEKERVNF